MVHLSSVLVALEGAYFAFRNIKPADRKVSIFSPCSMLNSLIAAVTVTRQVAYTLLSLFNTVTVVDPVFLPAVSFAFVLPCCGSTLTISGSAEIQVRFCSPLSPESRYSTLSISISSSVLSRGIVVADVVT